MKTIAFLLIIAIGIGSFLVAANAAENKREKRAIGILEFANMIRCETGKSASSYNDYGCWCGRGGSGRPVDDTDSCCKAHDLCYANLVRTDVCSDNAWFFTVYQRSGCSTCSLFNRGCGRDLCRCDRAAARCFKRELSTYDQRYKGHRSKGLC